MRAKDLIKVYLTRGTIVEDITDGILTIETSSGVDNFEGIWQTPEVGQFRIVSRSPNVDPYINDDVRYNSKIEIRSLENDLEPLIFTGYITDINVEYRPNDDAIVTINGTDIIGLLNRTVITSSHINAMKAAGYLDEDGIGNCFSVASWFGDGSNAEFPYLFALATKYQSGPSISYPVIDFKSRAMAKPGETVWDFTSKLIASDLSYAYVTPDSTIFIAPHYKYDAGYYPLKSLGLTTDEILNQEASICLSSDPSFDFDGQTGFGYKAININDGFDRTVNQIIFTSTTYTDVGGVMTETTAEFAPIITPSSIDEWGPAELSLDLYRPGIATRTQAFPIANDILELSSNPKLSVSSITVDRTKVYKTGYSGSVFQGQIYYDNFTPGDQVKIYHKINDSLFINNLYSVVGVKNEINETDWRVELIVRQSELESYLEKSPEPAEITISPATGNTSTNFVGTVTNYTTGQFTSIEWQPNGEGVNSLAFNPNPPSVWYDNDPSINYFYGLTASWNYDDDGPLGPTGVYGPYPYWVANVWVDKGGWKTMSSSEFIPVTLGTLTANFNYVKNNSTGQVTFTDLSDGAEEWLWDFGDGTTSTQQNPIKSYTSSGTFTVTLTTSDGIQTATTSKSIDIIAELIPVNWVKFEIKGTRTRANSTAPWDKHFITDIQYVSAVRLDDGGSSVQDPVYTQANVGTITNNVGTVLSNGYQSTRYLQPNLNVNRWLRVNPLTTNNGNTQQYDAEFKFNVSVRQSNDGLPLPLDPDSNWTSPTFNYQFRMSDSWIFPRSYVNNIVYEPINVYVSEDNVNWIKVGEWRITRSNQPPAGSYYGWSLSNKVQMPPRRYT